MRMRESGMIKRRINREIANLKIMEGVVRAGLPEWSKGGDLRSPMRRHAWVQTPQPASSFDPADISCVESSIL